MIYTLYHAPEDAHLVRPFARFIELTEVELVCVDAEPPVYSPTGLVMCGHGYESHPWLKKALRSSKALVAVLLADVDPGVRNNRRVDLRTWPGRSADRTVLALAEWLKSGGQSSFPGMNSASAARGAPQRTQNIAAFLILSVIVGLLFMMTQWTDRNAEVLTPLGPPPPTAVQAPSTGASLQQQTPTSDAAGSATKPTAPESGKADQTAVRNATGARAGTAAAGHGLSQSKASGSSPASGLRPAEAPKPGVDDIAASTAPDKAVQTRGLSRSELDRCYLLRQTDADVPSKTCMITQAGHYAHSQVPSERLEGRSD